MTESDECILCHHTREFHLDSNECIKCHCTKFKERF